MIQDDQFYIAATQSPVDSRARVLKQGETFAVFDLYGDIVPIGLREQGVYDGGTRFLSQWELKIGDRRPLLLNSTISQDNTLLTVDCTNPDIFYDGRLQVARGMVHVLRSKFLWQGVCHERLVIWNHSLEPVSLPVSIEFDADFADIFEVRGVQRRHRGRRLEPEVSKDAVCLPYRGLDEGLRQAVVHCSPEPQELSPSRIGFHVELPPRRHVTYSFDVACELDQRERATLPFEPAYEQAIRARQQLQSGDCRITTTNEQFNEWLERSRSDLYMMITETELGPYPFAGVPWFSCPFGRDGIITAFELLWINPAVARGVLRFLAETQAREEDAARDAEPGKILHESRKGEMARLNEVPFARYYGSVDATLLFVMLAGAYFERTADLAFIEWIWPHIELALEWMERYGDLDGDGFIEYIRHTPNGLLHQGWKDSRDSVFHADGRLADAPIALCEVQGYAYAARLKAASLAQALGHERRAEQLIDAAQQLRERFEKAFWLEDLRTYALALDGQKRPCRVVTSNPGHLLWTGMARPERARAVAETLLSEECFSGWGIRTVSTDELRYNPMSYHNGSVWPHDTALIGSGLAYYGFKEFVVHLLDGMFEASRYFDLNRLPELFCGFERRAGSGPTLYPVACAPQAWASGAVFMLLQGCLGLSLDATRRQVRFHRPALPESLNEVRITNLTIGHASLDLSVVRHPQDVGVQVVRRDGWAEVVVVK